MKTSLTSNWNIKCDGYHLVSLCFYFSWLLSLGGNVLNVHSSLVPVVSVSRSLCGNRDFGHSLSFPSQSPVCFSPVQLKNSPALTGSRSKPVPARLLPYSHGGWEERGQNTSNGFRMDAGTKGLPHGPGSGFHEKPKQLVTVSKIHQLVFLSHFLIQAMPPSHSNSKQSRRFRIQFPQQCKTKAEMETRVT